MRLEQYLTALRRCPDKISGYGSKRPISKLTSELGVYDNFALLFNSNGNGLPLTERPIIAHLVEELKEKGYAYTHTDSSGGFLSDASTRAIVFRETRSDADGSGYPYSCISLLTERTGKLGEDAKKHLHKQLTRYDAYLSLHLPNDRRYELSILPEMRLMTERIIDACELVARNRIPFCLPRSIGWDHSEDLSRIVYYDPRQKK